MMVQKRWPSDKAMQSYNYVKICYKLLYIIQAVLKRRYTISNFLASADIKVFGRTYLYTMLLLIGLALFYTQGVLLEV